jgi:hypothetical protein
MRRPRKPARELRSAIDGMPGETRRAMLDALGRNSIIVGAYASPDGGVCPMLAAHRNGGRTDFSEFARAWDRYAGVDRRPRLATEREVAALNAMLEASIAEEAGRAPDALRRAIAEHRRSQFARAQREEHDVAPLEPDYIASVGLTKTISGMKQAGEVLSR